MIGCSIVTSEETTEPDGKDGLLQSKRSGGSRMRSAAENATEAWHLSKYSDGVFGCGSAGVAV